MRAFNHLCRAGDLPVLHHTEFRGTADPIPWSPQHGHSPIWTAEALSANLFIRCPVQQHRVSTGASTSAKIGRFDFSWLKSDIHLLPQFGFRLPNDGGPKVRNPTAKEKANTKRKRQKMQTQRENANKRKCQRQKNKCKKENTNKKGKKKAQQINQNRSDTFALESKLAPAVSEVSLKYIRYSFIMTSCVIPYILKCTLRYSVNDADIVLSVFS